MNDVQMEVLGYSEIEKGNSPTLAFLNNDVASLSWKDLSVKVSDRVTKLDKYILQGSSGIVRAGKKLIPTSFAMTLLTQLQGKSLL
jgi:hypothetical protein